MTIITNCGLFLWSGGRTLVSLALATLVISTHVARAAQIACPASAPITCQICVDAPLKITTPGKTYCLAKDITTADRFEIAADDTTLDGLNHTITMTGGNWLEVIKPEDPAFPGSGLNIPTYRVKIQNFNVYANGVAYADFMGFASMRDSVFQDNVIKLLNARPNGLGGKLFGMYQSHRNIFQRNRIIQHLSGGDSDGWNMRNGSCGNQFIDNVFVAATSLGQGLPVKLNSGDQTQGRGSPEDNIFSGNQFFAASGNMVWVQAAEGATTFENNLIYAASGIGMDIPGFSAGSTVAIRNNTIVALGGKGIQHQTLNLKQMSLDQNIIYTRGGYVFDTHAPLKGDLNNYVREDSDLMFWSEFPSAGREYKGFATWQAAVRASGMDINSISAGALSTLFVNPSVNLALDAAGNPLSLGDFRLLAGAARPRNSAGASIEPGSPGLNGVVHPLYCRKVDSSPTPVTDTQAPTVSITSPTNGSSVQANVQVSVAAADNVGVTKVELYRDGTTLVGSTMSAPYTITLAVAGLSNGAHQLVAKAYDAASNSASSATISINVSISPAADTQAPSISISSPTSGSVLMADSIVRLAASDNVGVTKVELYLDGTILVGSSTSSPYQIALPLGVMTSGTHRLTGKAYDTAGNIGTSAVVSVTAILASTGDPNQAPPSDPAIKAGADKVTSAARKLNVVSGGGMSCAHYQGLPLDHEAYSRSALLSLLSLVMVCWSITQLAKKEAILNRIGLG